MDNENKEIELETQDIEPAANNDAVDIPESEPEFNEAEFDPTESEEFYNNLEAAIGGEIVQEAATDVPEFTFSEDDFFFGEEKDKSVMDPEMEEELFAGVNAALSEQIAQEFGEEEAGSEEEEEESSNKFLAFFKRIPTWVKVLSTIILVLLISVALLFGTKGGRSLLIDIVTGIAMNKIQEDPIDTSDISVTPEPIMTPTYVPSPTPEPSVTPEPTEGADITGEATPEPTEEPTETPTPTLTPTPTITIMDDPDVINVLLIGVENMKQAVNGRSDAMVLISVNLNGGPIKMVSFQRDLYVAIRNHNYDKLNHAYAYAGASRLVETIENNFGIDIDSYIKVEFGGFEDIIDSLGGLRMSLTARESEWMNTSKYVSKPEERNTVPGEQVLTGAQVLAHCRNRFMPTVDGIIGDRGRNARQRAVLQALFNQFKEKNIVELYSVMNQCFEYVSAPADLRDTAPECLKAVVENKMFELETMQFPQSKMYESKMVVGADGNDMDVIIYYPEAVNKLQEFIYGE